MDSADTYRTLQWPRGRTYHKYVTSFLDRSRATNVWSALWKTCSPQPQAATQPAAAASLTALNASDSVAKDVLNSSTRLAASPHPRAAISPSASLGTDRSGHPPHSYRLSETVQDIAHLNGQLPLSAWVVSTSHQASPLPMSPPASTPPPASMSPPASATPPLARSFTEESDEECGIPVSHRHGSPTGKQGSDLMSNLEVGLPTVDAALATPEGLARAAADRVGLDDAVAAAKAALAAVGLSGDADAMTASESAVQQPSMPPSASMPPLASAVQQPSMPPSASMPPPASAVQKSKYVFAPPPIRTLTFKSSGSSLLVPVNSVYSIHSNFQPHSLQHPSTYRPPAGDHCNGLRTCDLVEPQASCFIPYCLLWCCAMSQRAAAQFRWRRAPMRTSMRCPSPLCDGIA